MRRVLERRDARLSRCEQVLRALGPGATLERGYAIVTDAHGQLMRDAQDVEIGAVLTTRLARGRFDGQVLKRELAPDEDDPPPQS